MQPQVPAGMLSISNTRQHHLSRGQNVRAMLRRLFPGGFSNSLYNSFKLVLVAEGYLANETARFIGDCIDLVDAFINTASFGLTRAYRGWLSIYAGFAANAQSGPAINPPAAANRTGFESSLTMVTGMSPIRSPAAIRVGACLRSWRSL